MNWYDNDVKEVIEKRLACTYKPETIFYGSSTIKQWNTLEEDFKEYKPINLGFGGSTLAACVWFFEEIVAPIKAPGKFILYAGDNDLGDGRFPEEVFIFYKEFLLVLRKHYKHVPFYFISIKPSLEREEIMDNIIYTNKLIENDILKNKGNNFFINTFNQMISTKGKPLKTLFESDGLHLNDKGYAIWKTILLRNVFNASK